MTAARWRVFLVFMKIISQFPAISPSTSQTIIIPFGLSSVAFRYAASDCTVKRSSSA